MKCHVCNGDGFTVGTAIGYGHGCDGTQEMCDRVCPVPVPEPCQEPCEACNATGEVKEHNEKEYEKSTKKEDVWKSRF